MQDGVAFANLDGRRVAYEVRGDGDEAIVFVHGWSGDRSHWSAQMAQDGLDTDRRLVAVDLIGHGESDAPEIEYTMDLFARSVAAVLDDLHIDRAVLVGHSNGVPVVRQFYRLYPDRTEALVAVDGALKRMDPAMIQQMAEPLRRPNYRQVMEAMMEQMPMVAPGLSEEEIDHLRAVTLATPQHVLLGSSEALLDPAIWEEDEIAVPLLVVMAKNPFTPLSVDEAEAFVRKIAPRVEFHVWEGVSHLFILERPDQFNAQLEAFLARLEAGGI